jgi:type IV secretion system protein VirB10
VSGPPESEKGRSPKDSAERRLPPDEGVGEVPGERGIPSVNRVRSLQSRVTGILTLVLLFGLTAGLLTWYYAGAIHRGGRAKELAEAAAKRRAQGESTLPSLGAIKAPKTVSETEVSPLDRILTEPPPLSATDAPEVPMVTANPYANPTAPPGAPVKTPADLELERRLGGPVLAASTDRSAPEAGGAQTPSGAETLPPQTSGAGEEGSSKDPLGSLLKPTATPAVRARVLATQRFMLPKGAFIDCTLETAISSALPGLTTCVTATDTFSADGAIVLLERGSKLVGETRGEVQQGKPRLFVLWTEARTPTGVIVPLASPGTDELGRSGLTGTIDRHWWLRFGDAILITVIDGAVQGLTEGRGGGNTLVLNPSTTGDVGTEILRNTLNTPPTIEKPQGDRIEILVARDVDFRSVYALHASAEAP